MDRRTALSLPAAVAAAPYVGSCLPVLRPKTVGTAPNGQILIMPLGDSLTWGDGSTGGNGYRLDLADRLTGPNETHNALFVGSQQNGTSGDIYCEGHPGWTIGQLIGGVQGGWLTNPPPAYSGPPQIVLLQGGANDAIQGRTSAQMLADMGTLLDLVLATTPDIVVVLGEQILFSGDVSHTLSQGSRVQQAFNAGLPNLVASRPAGRVVMAHLGLIPQASLSADGVHPSDIGYRQMSYLLYRALAPYLGIDGYMVNSDCPFPSIPILT